MQKSKLLAVLRTFSPSEWSRLDAFLHSPYFNRRTDVCALFEYLRAQAQQGFPAAGLEKAAVWEALFPEEQADATRLNHLNNWLLQLVETFLSIERYREQEPAVRDNLLQVYLERDLYKHFHFQWRKSRRQLAEQPADDLASYRQRYLLWERREAWVARRNERKYNEALQRANDYLDQYYFARKARYLSEMLDMQQFITGHYRLSMLAEVRAALRAAGELPPLLRVYDKLLDLFDQQGSERAFNRLLEAWRAHLPAFSPADAKRLLYHAINFCVYRINQGERRYAHALQALYEEGIQTGILLENGLLSPWTFKNMVRLGLGLKQYEWVESFVLTYSDRLPEREKEDALHYNLADVYYHQQQYDPAMDHLKQVEYTDVHYHLGAKVMLLKIYFEKGEEEAFWSLLSALRVFLRRDGSVARNVKRAYSNFAIWSGRIFRMRPEDAEPFRRKLDATRAVNDRSWLLQQIERKGAGKSGS